MLSKLNPSLLWKHFYAMTQIPHPSGHEEKIIEYIVNFAKIQKLEYKKDEIGNVLITKPATSGMENRPVVVLQGHVDMVAEKNQETVHNFFTDLLKIRIDGDFVKATDTTLGADNGIGVATALAVLEDNYLVHGPIECLFTVDEEAGMGGALNINADWFKGKILFNLDSEEDDTLYIGCAGGKHTILSHKIERAYNSNYDTCVKITLDGLQGGHSGMMISAGLGNAIKLLARFLYELKKDTDFCLSSILGGDKHNAIPREASAVLMLKKENLTAVKTLIQKYSDFYKNELKLTDKNVNLNLVEQSEKCELLSKTDSVGLINLLYGLPHGVLSMSFAIHGLVEASTNLASIKEIGGEIVILTSQRSSTASLIEEASDKIRVIGELCDYTILAEGGYPGWQPDPSSPILKTAKTVYTNLFGKEPHVKAIHAGLECGILGAKYPGLDMISFGPNIFAVHSPEEKVQISSVEKFWRYLTEILKAVN